MWFKNLMIYRFTRPLETGPDELEQRLAEFAFEPCGSQDQSKFGWIEAMGRSGQTYTHNADGCILICAKKEEKILPPSVIKEMVEERAEQLEQENGRALKKKEKEALKEEITMQLLPRAFSRYQQTYAWLNPAAGLLVVDAGSSRKAEDVIALLRKTLGSLPVVPVSLTVPAEVTMTEWLTQEQLPAGFELGDEAELRSAMEHGGIIRCKQQELLCDEIKNHLDNDKLVTKLALTWREKLSFVLEEEMQIKRLKFSEFLKEENEDIDTDDFAARFDADFALLSGELNQYIPELIDALGGEQPRD